MLKRLTIKDYALIAELRVDFGAGLNILTGETGAGKSIIIGALSLLLGERAKTNVIRQGADMAVVEGEFQLSDMTDLSRLSEHVESDGPNLLLRREVHMSGKSRCFANDALISNKILSDIGDALIDLHGQHDHQTLLRTEKHLEFLDNFGVDTKIRDTVRESYHRFQNIVRDLGNLREKEQQLNEKRDLLAFRLNEITSVDPKPGEEAELLSEEKVMNSSEKIFEASETLSRILYEGEGSVSEKLSTAEQLLGPLTNVDKPFHQWYQSCEEARINIQDLVKGIQQYTSKVDFNPERLEAVRERLGQFSRLKKKYGATIEEVISVREKTSEELNRIETMGKDIENLENSLQTEKDNLNACTTALSQKRKMVAAELEKRVLDVLSELGLVRGQFEVRFRTRTRQDGPVMCDGENVAVFENGFDIVEFYISLNPGQDPRPLSQVASGGEISRIMLALKTVLADADSVPVMVFDEIDTGISGRIARVVGKKLKTVSAKRQIVCITHLAQIASMGDIHFSVQKKVSGNETRTIVVPVQESDRVMEIAKLLGGETVTESVIQNARELLNSEAL